MTNSNTPQPNQDSFDKFENAGRKLLKDFFFDREHKHKVTDLEFIPGKYSKSDLFYLSGWTITASELKTRDYPLEKTFGQSSGWLLEKGKYDELQSHITSKKANACTYIHIFQNGIVLWDLTNLVPKWISKLCWKDHTRTRKVIKEICYLQIEQASHIIRHPFNLRPTG